MKYLFTLMTLNFQNNMNCILECQNNLWCSVQSIVNLKFQDNWWSTRRLKALLFLFQEMENDSKLMDINQHDSEDLVVIIKIQHGFLKR